MYISFIQGNIEITSIAIGVNFPFLLVFVMVLIFYIAVSFCHIFELVVEKSLYTNLSLQLVLFEQNL